MTNSELASDTRPRDASALPRRAWSFLALLTSVTAAFCGVWIVFPAPFTLLWLVAVAAGEWSLWLVALALFGILLALVARAQGGRWAWRLALGLSFFAAAFALLPPLSAYRAASANNVRLSLRDYFAPLLNVISRDASEPDARAPTTYTFATIDKRELRLDAYMPAQRSSEAVPAILVVHGGSWSGGERSDFPQWDHWLARHGYAVFDVDYRLAPQPNWQTATGDVKCAVLWVKGHAANFGVDPSRIALLGRSAGGHLALLAAYAADDARLPSSCVSKRVDDEGDIKTDASVRAVASFYAPTDLLWAYDNPANQRVLDGPATLRRFLGGDPHANEEIHLRYELASPVMHVDAGKTPPTLLIHGGHDQLVRAENMERLSQKLRAAGVTHQAVFIPYAQHGFDYNFNGWGAQIVKPLMLNFFNKAFAAEKMND